MAKLYLIIIVMGLLSGVGYGGYNYYLWSEQTISTLRENNVKLKSAAETLQATVERIQADAKKNEQRRSLVNAFTYPSIILITAILVVAFMLRLVVPMFEDIFRQNQVELPWITRWVISLSNIMENFWMLFIVLPLAFWALNKWVFNGESVKRLQDKIVLKIPFIGSFVKTVYLAQFTKAMGLLTASKVPMLNGIELASQMIGFTPLKEALHETSAKILKGASLSESLKDNDLFDSKMISLIKVAEQTNETQFIFERLNRQYSIEVDQKSKLLTTLLEPAIILVVGTLVGIILISMYLPMFKLSTVLG